MRIQKILAYDVYANTTGTTRYQRVLNLLNQTIDPATLLPNSLDCSQQTVFTSPRKRAVTCINSDSASSVTEHQELNEIAFSLQEFCSEEDFLKNGSDAVRRAFVQAFIENKLSISHKQLQIELESVFELNKQANPPLCISHTFRMKLLEIYANVGNDLFQNPVIIKDFTDSSKHMYEFGEIIEI